MTLICRARPSRSLDYTIETTGSMQQPLSFLSILRASRDRCWKYPSISLPHSLDCLDTGRDGPLYLAILRVWRTAQI